MNRMGRLNKATLNNTRNFTSIVTTKDDSYIYIRKSHFLTYLSDDAIPNFIYSLPCKPLKKMTNDFFFYSSRRLMPIL